MHRKKSFKKADFSHFGNPEISGKNFGWHLVSEKLPDVSDWYLVFVNANKGGFCDVIWWEVEKGEWRSGSIQPDAWQKLPPAPHLPR